MRMIAALAVGIVIGIVATVIAFLLVMEHEERK